MSLFKINKGGNIMVKSFRGEVFNTNTDIQIQLLDSFDKVILSLSYFVVFMSYVKSLHSNSFTFPLNNIWRSKTPLRAAFFV